MTFVRGMRVVVLVLIAAFQLVVGCAATDDAVEPTTGATVTTAAGTGGTGQGGASTTSSGSSSDGGFGFGGSFGIGGAGVGGMQTCEQIEADAEVVPLDVVMVLDRSGSMETQKLWGPFQQAITDFIKHPGSAGLSVGMNFYPAAAVNGCPSGYGACNESLYGYQSGLQVPIVELPANEGTLLSAVQAQKAEGDCTPTYGALKGSLQFARQHQDANPKRKVIVVLASDGAPNGCPPAPVDANDPGVIADLASNIFNYNGVLTFTIAIAGAKLPVLDQIAAAGGTTAAFDITSDINGFIKKMQDIQGTLLACEFLIPDPTKNGVEFDANKVNVIYTPGDMSGAQNLPQVASADKCGDGVGWYYDNPSQPTKVSLCKASCDIVQADKMAKVRVAFGCPTILK